MSSTLVIPFVTSELPTCNPNLMPFHIDYNGPAAVSAFMRVEKFKPEEVTREKEAKDELSGDTDASLEEKTVETSILDVEMKADASITVQPPISNGDADVDMKTSVPATTSTEPDPESQTLSIATESTLVVESQTSLASDTTQAFPLAPTLEDADKRSVSSFRGRTIHGLTIELPHGYSGLVLQSEGDSTSSSTKAEDTKNSGAKGKASAKAKASGKGKSKEKEAMTTKPRGRLTRSAISKRVEVISIEDDDEEMADPNHNLAGSVDHLEAVAEIPDDRLIRNLVPKAQFSSFTLWHADRPVDKGNDEYSRALTEWIALSHEIHRTDL